MACILTLINELMYTKLAGAAKNVDVLSHVCDLRKGLVDSAVQLLGFKLFGNTMSDLSNPAALRKRTDWPWPAL